MSFHLRIATYVEHYVTAEVPRCIMQRRLGLVELVRRGSWRYKAFSHPLAFDAPNPTVDYCHDTF